MNKAVFLDRDGIINQEIGDYVYKKEDFKLVNGIVETLSQLKKNGFLLVVITNQAGIAKGRYTHTDVQNLHSYFQELSGGLIDKFYYAPHHPEYSSESFSRKPGSLLFEKAIARFDIDPKQSWMVGDKERDLIPAKKMGIRTVRVFIDGFFEEGEPTIGEYSIRHVKELQGLI